MPAEQFFRYLWRTNAVLILFAAGAIIFGVGLLVWEESGVRSTDHRSAQTGVVVAPESKEDLTLGHAEVIPGTTVMRADLYVRREAGFSSGSGGYGEVEMYFSLTPMTRPRIGFCQTTTM